MAFPETNLDVDVNLDLDGSGTYATDISTFVMPRDSNGTISIRRGKQSEGSQTEPDSCTLTLNNRDGRFSPRNPLGPYFGQLGRNTGIQVAVHGGDRYLNIGASGDRVSTPDAAVLDITGDIDVRVDMTYRGDFPQSQELIGKRAGAGQISWYLLRNSSGSLSLAWSTNGTALTFFDGTEKFPQPPEHRVAVRATLDVNNGLGGYTVTYYYAQTIDTAAADWVQFDQQVTTGGTTSIFNSTADLEIGDLTDAVSSAPIGRIHKAEVYNGIDGTLVANPDFRIQTAGAASFADTTASPRTWTLEGAASISDKKIRFTGEVAEWPVEWDVSGNDIWTEITAGGILRRLEANSEPLQSTLRRRIPTLNNLLAYWPMEDPDGSTRFNSPLTNVRHIAHSGMKLSEQEGPRGSDLLPVIQTGATLFGIVPNTGGGDTAWHTEFVFNMPAAPAVNTTLLAWSGTGTIANWELRLRTGFFHLRGVDSDATEVIATDFAITNADVFGKDCRMQLFATQNGGNIDYRARIIRINATPDPMDTGVQSFAGTVGRIYAVTNGRAGYALGANDTMIGHVSVWRVADTTAYNSADHAFNDESASTRIARLAAEEGFDFEVTDFDPDVLSERLGSQGIDTLLGVMREAEESDRGILTGMRDDFRVKYIPLESIENAWVSSTFDYETDLMPGIKPVDDDRPLGNKWVVVNRFGPDGTAEKTEGTLSSANPPNGVGLYAQSSNINAFLEDRAQDHANWLVHQHTVDEARFPVINFNLARNPELIEDLTRLDVGHRFQITNIPAKLMYNDLDLLVGGYEEEINQRRWEVTFHAEPFKPFIVGEIGHATLARLDSDDSVLQAAVNSTATTMVVEASEGPTWTQDTANFPFDAQVGGERVTVTDISGGAEDDFGTNQTDSWGTADVGGTWTLEGGTNPGDYDVTGGLATHTMGSVGVSRRSSLAAIAFDDADLRVDIQSSQTATGAAITGGLMARYTDVDNLYTARVAFNTNSTVTLTVRKRVAGVETLLASYTAAFTYVVNTSYRVRFRVFGTTLKAKIWDASRGEPENWQIETTDSAITVADAVGCRSFLESGNTNATPIVRYDNFNVTNPTTWTVTRSVNGVVKSQTAGTAISLWQPTILAL